MEDWVDAIKMRLQGEQFSLPPEDWERFRADYLGRKKQHQILPWVLALAAAAGVAIVLLVNKPASDVIVAPIVENSFHNMTSDANAGIKQEEVVSSVDRPEPIIGFKDELAVSVPLSVGSELEHSEKETERRDTMPQSQKEPDQIIPEKPVFNDVFFEKESMRKRLAFAPYVRGFRGDATLRTSSSLPGYGYIIDETTPTIESKTRHSIPFTFGFEASLPLRPRLQLTSGVELSIYLSDFSIVKSSTTQDYAQKAYYLGVPLRLEWLFWQQDRFSAWIGAGGKIDYLVYGKLGDVRIKDNTLHYSVVGDMGLEYKLFPRVGFFLQPEISYYFKPSSPEVLTYRTEHPFCFTLGTGFRFFF